MTTEFVEKLRKDATTLYESEVLINERIESQCVKDMREAADMIEELSLKLHNSQMERSSQFYHSGWIPVDERLPAEPFGCLVTVWDSTPTGEGDDFENILPYFVGYDGKQWNDADGRQCPFEVIAWMPLPPEPYKADKEGKE